VRSKEGERLNGEDVWGSNITDASFIPQKPDFQLPIPSTVSSAQVQQLSPAVLAYLGDAIYELHVRMFYLLPQQRPETYHCLVVAQVRAETQALHLRSLTPHLRDKELEIVRRGRNAATGRPKRLDPEIYQQATSLETLVGYLYLTDYQRLIELLQKLHLER
jgi:ribonuclease-3 family protein